MLARVCSDLFCQAEFVLSISLNLASRQLFLTTITSHLNTMTSEADIQQNPSKKFPPKNIITRNKIKKIKFNIGVTYVFSQYFVKLTIHVEIVAVVAVQPVH